LSIHAAGWTSLILLCTAAGAISIAAADELSRDKKAAEKPADAKESALPNFSAEREAAALTFVRQNHPELASLLTAMSKKNPAQYQNAVRDLYKTSERITNLRSKDSRRADLELDVWKHQSRINLLAARLRTADSPKLRDDLRKAVADKVDASTRRLEYDVVEARARVEKQEKALQSLKDKREKSIENLYQASLRSAKPTKKEKVKAAVDSKETSPEKSSPKEKK
jgi:hypothetical protein